MLREGINRLLGLIAVESNRRNLKAEDDLAWRQAEIAEKQRHGQDYIPSGKGAADDMLAGGNITIHYNGPQKSMLGKLAPLIAAAVTGGGIAAAALNYLNKPSPTPTETVILDPTQVDIRGSGKPIK